MLQSSQLSKAVARRLKQALVWCLPRHSGLFTFKFFLTLIYTIRSGSRGLGPPLFLDQNKLSEINYFWDRAPPLIPEGLKPPLTIAWVSGLPKRLRERRFASLSASLFPPETPDTQVLYIPLDCLQSAFCLKIRLVLISSSAIANHHVIRALRFRVQ